MSFMAAYKPQKAGQMELIDKQAVLDIINSYGGADATEPEDKRSDDLVRAIYADVDSISSWMQAAEVTNAEYIRSLPDDELEAILKRAVFCGSLKAYDCTSEECRGCKLPFCCDIGNWLHEIHK